MNATTLYHIALVAHITGLTIMAGTTVADYVIFKQFWKFYAVDPVKGMAINEATSKFVVLFGLGVILLIISGVCMMAITHGAFGEQLWFRIKFAFVVLIIINGLTVGRRQRNKLTGYLAIETANGDVKAGLLKVKGTLGLFHISQLTMFVIIFVLSVFKFN